MRAVRLITGKELRVQTRRRTLFVLGFAAPLALAFVMNLVFGGIDDPDAPVTFDVAVVDLDGGEVASGFVATIDEIAESGLFDVHDVDGEAGARDAVDSGDVGAAWILPAGFSDAVTSGGAATITVIADVDSPTTASVARSIANGYATRVGTGTLAAMASLETGVATPTDLGEIAASVAGDPSLLTLTATETDSSQLDTATSLVAGMALFFAFFTAGLPLLGIIEERDNATLARLLVAPIPEGAILAGKTLAALVLGTVSLVSLMVASAVLMGAEWGPPLGALLLVVAAIVAVSGIMSVAGSAAHTAETAGNIQAIVAVVLAMLGGAFVPIPTNGGVLEFLHMLTPHGWFYEGLEALQGGDVAAVLPAVGVLLLMGGVTLAIGMSLARSALRR